MTDLDASRPGYRCKTCGLLSLGAGACVECGGEKTEVVNVYNEAVRDAIDQSAHVLDWKDPALAAIESIAAFRRY